MTYLMLHHVNAWDAFLSSGALFICVLAALVNSMLHHMEYLPEHIRTVLLVLTHVASTQPQMTQLPDKALKVSALTVGLIGCRPQFGAETR